MKLIEQNNQNTQSKCLVYQPKAILLQVLLKQFLPEAKKEEITIGVDTTVKGTLVTWNVETIEECDRYFFSFRHVKKKLNFWNVSSVKLLLTEILFTNQVFCQSEDKPRVNTLTGDRKSFAWNQVTRLRPKWGNLRKDDVIHGVAHLKWIFWSYRKR